MIESVFDSHKEEQNVGVLYPSRSVARQELVDYIEMFYNCRRRHSSFGVHEPHVI